MNFIILFIAASTLMIGPLQAFVLESQSFIPKYVHLTQVDDENDLYALSTSTNSLDVLINEKHDFQLILDPELRPINGTEPKIQSKFSCIDDDHFDWNKDEIDCDILKLTPSYEYNFDVNSTNPKNITVETLKPGKIQLIARARWIQAISNDNKTTNINTRKAYINLNVGRSDTIIVISTIIGWIYFIAWSVSFYPQIWENFTRKSVVGLNFDFIALNITGFLSYSMFNAALYWVDEVQEQYEKENPRSQIPVELNDVVFGLHASFATIITIIQCFIYERGEQTVAWIFRIFLAVVYIGYIILGILVATTSVLNMLDFLYIASYVKLAITIIKYIPQAWYNYKRKSTVGWSIGNIFLDSTGGVLSMIQMFMLAYNYDDWITIFKNFTKFGLGLFSILFDLLFILQHYVFYRHNRSDSKTLLFDNPTSVNTKRQEADK